MTYATSTPTNVPRKYNTIETDAPDHLSGILSPYSTKSMMIWKEKKNATSPTQKEHISEPLAGSDDTPDKYSLLLSPIRKTLNSVPSP
jgi:hypothetical protein